MRLIMKFEKRINESGKAYVYLNLEKLEIPGINFDIEPYLKFKIETYMALRANSTDADWDAVFGITYDFINSFTKEEQQQFASMLILMHYQILQVLGGEPDDPIDHEALKELETNLSDTLMKFDKSIDLLPRLVKYTYDYIPISSFKGVGERPQDSESKTFRRAEVIDLTAIVLLCKLMTPILGIFIEACKKRLDGDLKDIHCVAIFKGILSYRCQPLIDKLTGFMDNIVTHTLRETNLSLIYHGCTIAMILQRIYAAMLVRKFIAVDLKRPNGNLMTYITGCARAATTAQFTGAAFKTAVQEIRKVEEQKTGSDEGNVSSLENESKSSDKTADFGIIIKAAVKQLESRFIIEQDLDPEIIEAAQNYYQTHHVILSPTNSYLLATLFGSYLCGARSIEMLDAVSISKIIPIMQAWMIQQGYPELVHPVSLIYTRQPKKFRTGTDTQLRNSWNSSPEYINCEARFPFQVGDIRWDTRLAEIVDNLTSEMTEYNTAPVFWDMLHQDSLNGTEYFVPENLAKVICMFIAQMFPDIEG